VTKIKKSNPTPLGPIIGMTAYAQKMDEENCLAAGMDAHNSKPINFKKSLQVIADIIKQTATP
jgi:CheY-like chemotaxis protein